MYDSQFDWSCTRSCVQLRKTACVSEVQASYQGLNHLMLIWCVSKKAKQKNPSPPNPLKPHPPKQPEANKKIMQLAPTLCQTSNYKQTAHGTVAVNLLIPVTLETYCNFLIAVAVHFAQLFFHLQPLSRLVQSTGMLSRCSYTAQKCFVLGCCEWAQLFSSIKA